MAVPPSPSSPPVCPPSSSGASGSSGSSGSPSEGGSRTGVMMLCATAAVFLAISLCGGHDPSSDGRPPHAPGRLRSGHPCRRPAGPSSSNARDAEPSGRHLRRSRPVRLLIPKISVNAPFTDLAIGRSGRLDPPPADDVNLVGWHAKGASPGEAGTAIIAGHVDTKTSPAVFARAQRN